MAQPQNLQLQLALDFVEHTNKNIFLTGKAGTGKTTFLQNLKKRLLKRMVVVAPTGVAAMNAGGVTIHSFFQLPFGPYLPVPDTGLSQSNERQVKKITREKIDIIRSLDLLVIDEISMVRADTLDAIDEVLRRYKDRSQPFGGVQLLMIGDLQQLAPVAKEDEWNLLRAYYNTVFFFGSRALQQTEYVSIMLQHIYRQRDNTFINILNAIRENKLNQELLHQLNRRYIEDFSPSANEGYITLTTHNQQAQLINEQELRKISGKEERFKATVEGDFPEYIYPTEHDLVLKKGAQVMFVKNDTSFEKRYYNGKIVTIKDIREDIIVVQGKDDPNPIYVEMVDWHNYKYALDDQTKEIKETITGTFKQFPLKLAWAITIHKSQGLTFDKAIIDANAAFTHGQVYVALSRCRSLEGLVLRKPLALNSIISDSSIIGFNSRIEKNQPTPTALEAARQQYQQRLVLELFDFKLLRNRIGYCHKVLRENTGSIVGNLHEEFNAMESTFQTAVTEISDKFQAQMRNLGLHEGFVEENEPLQSRIKQAAVYFVEKVDAIVMQPLKGVTLETDNKEVKKAAVAALENLYKEANIKSATLKASTNGFVSLAYMKARAKAALEEADIKPLKKTEGPTNIAHPQLYRKLRQFRDQKAGEWDVAQYMVLTLKTMEELTIHKPRTIAALKKISGLGKKKIEQMGEEILAVINSLPEDQLPPLETADNATQSKSDSTTGKETEKGASAAPKTRKLGDTKKESFDLFLSGKTIDQIAVIRNLAPSTIESHLAHYVGTGEIDVTELMPLPKLKLIEDYYTQNGLTTFSEAKTALGDSATFGELRLVVKHLEHKQKL